MIKELRVEKKLTQQKAADLVGISLRSYKSYENDEDKIGSLKYNYIQEKLEEYNKIDENHGILEIEVIKNKCSKVFSKYEVDYCYLFGSYAKDNPNEKSDVDLLVSTELKGLKFFGLVEELRESLRKKVEVLNINQLKDNFELTTEILRDGIRIYG